MWIGLPRMPLVCESIATLVVHSAEIVSFLSASHLTQEATEEEKRSADA